MVRGDSAKAGYSIVFSLVLILLVAIHPASAQGSGYWGATASYPISVDDESCVGEGTYLYCVGGFTGDTYTADGLESTNKSYFAAVSSSGGIANWSNTTNYPTIVNTASCVASDSYVYCVGGYAGSGVTNAVYYAGASSAGLSQWKNTTNYPLRVFSQSCSSWDGYVYCVGGYSPSGLPVDAVYYARAGPSGLGAWTRGADYPTNITGQSCPVSAGYIYCVGGIDDSSPAVTNAVYYAALSPGVSTWIQTTSYPTPVDIQSCVVWGDDLYCIGGAPNFAATDSVYYAPLMPSGGLGAWVEGASYPVIIGEQSCVASSGFIYCIAGAPSAAVHTAAVYYVDGSSLLVDTTQSSSTDSSSVVMPTTRAVSQTGATSSMEAAGSLGTSWSYLLVLSVNVTVLLTLLVVSFRRKEK